MMKDLKLSQAPWTPEQVKCLERWQSCTYVHPFTSESGPDGEQVNLIPTTEGWVKTIGGPVIQTWAHLFMVEFQGWSYP